MPGKGFKYERVSILRVCGFKHILSELPVGLHFQGSATGEKKFWKPLEGLLSITEKSDRRNS
jgi:hypothetical protein